MDFEALPKEFTRSAEPAEGDTAMARKRSRRVSFADTTAVHVFDRDEDYETPPDTKPGTEVAPGSGLGGGPLGFHGDYTESDDTRSPLRRGDDGDDGEERDGGEEEHELFVRRDTDSFSPASAAGSMTSNDDDNLFGPVSTSFIRSGRLSEVSDDNDITLDSTAFSMHFSNVLPLDDRSMNSGGSPRTPTGDSEAKDSGFIPLLGTTKKVLDFALPNAKSSGSTGYSSDMTIVAENSKSYDYGKLPPTLEVLLAKVNEAMQPQYLNDADISSLHSRSPNTGTRPPACASTGEVDEATFSSTHKAKDNIQKAKLSSLGPTDASETDAISLPFERSQEHFSLLQDHMPIHDLIDRITDNGYCASVSDVRAHIAPSAVQISSESHECKMHTPTVIQNGNQHMHSPMTSSVSSLRAKRQQLFDVASVSLQSGSTMRTPLSSKRNITLNSEGSSINKNSVAKFETFEMEESLGSKSRTLLLAHDHRPHGFKATLDNSERYDDAKHLNMSHCQAGAQAMGITGGVAGFEMNSKMQVHVLETPGSLRRSRCDEEGRATTDTGKRADDVIQIPGAGMQKIEKSPRSGNPTEGASFSPIFSSSKQKMYDVKENDQVLNTLSKFVSSPMSLCGHEHPVPQDQCFTPLASGSIKLNSSLKEMRSETPLSHVTFSFIDTRKLDNQNATPVAGTVSQIPHEENVVCGRNLQPLSQVTDHKMGKDLGNMIRQIADERSAVLSFPGVPKKAFTIKESEQHCLIDRSPGSAQNRLGGNDIPKAFPLRNAVSQDPVANAHMGTRQDICSSKKSFALLADDSIRHKRRSEEIPLADDTIDEPGRTPKSQRVMPGIRASISGFSPAQQRQHVVRDNEACGNLSWNELLTKIIEGTKEPFSPSVNRLNLPELDLLEDLVCELQKAGKYERLCTDVQNLGKYHDFGHQKRMSEIRLLKETLLYERAKLQLKSIKHDRLLKRAHGLQSKIHDFDKLRSSFKQAVDRESSLLLVSVSKKMVEDEHEKVLSMRQELRTLDEKIKGFVNFFATSCNVGGSLSIDEIIKVTCDDLDMRNRCRIIHQHLRLWKMIDVVNQNDQYDIVLDYCNLLSQRFTVKVTPASRFGVEVSLNDANIEKSFPNMKASSAFHFVFHGLKGHKRLGNIKCFQKETQATSFILGNLLDVLEELRLSQIENPNLMSSTFCAQSAGKLELQLHFLDLKSGKKVALSLDMTCLNCSVYPSEPSELKMEVSSLNWALSQSLSDEMISTVQSLNGGHSLLMRLCRCVSQFIQASKI